MDLYEYSWRNHYSTKPSKIMDQQKNLIGTINKKYSNVLFRILDVFFQGKYFVEYEVRDTNNEVVLKAKGDLNPFKRRQYKIDYFEGGNHYQFQLIDKKRFDIVERTDFDFGGCNFQLKKAPLEWAKLYLGDKLIAEWHVPLKPPFKCRFKLYDNTYNNRILFFIGIFHSYFNAT